MASHSLDDALDALVELIAAVEGVRKSVRGPVLRNQLPASSLPHVQVIEGGDDASHAITSTTQLRQMVGMRLIYNPSETSEAAAIGIREAILDAMNADLSLSGKCISCIAGPSDPPMNFPAKGGHCIRDFYAELTYWREF